MPDRCDPEHGESGLQGELLPYRSQRDHFVARTAIEPEGDSNVPGCSGVCLLLEHEEGAAILRLPRIVEDAALVGITDLVPLWVRDHRLHYRQGLSDGKTRAHHADIEGTPDESSESRTANQGSCSGESKPLHQVKLRHDRTHLSLERILAAQQRGRIASLQSLANLASNGLGVLERFQAVIGADGLCRFLRNALRKGTRVTEKAEDLPT